MVLALQDQKVIQVVLVPPVQRVTMEVLQQGSNAQVNSLGVGTSASGTTGSIRATNDITAYYSSDLRLKENINKINEPLKK